MRGFLLALAAACAGPPSSVDVPVVYVGEVDDGEEGASIALAVTRERLVVYGCGDDPLDGDYLGWVGVGLAPGQGEARFEQGRWSFDGFWDDQEATGVITGEDGTPYGFWARPVPSGQLDGLYLKQGRRCMTAVIVDGDVLRGAWWCTGGELAQVTPLFPLELVDGRLAVELRLETETHRIEVSPVRAPLP